MSKISSKQLDLNLSHFSNDNRSLYLAPDSVDYSIYGMRWVDIEIEASAFTEVSGNSEYELFDEAITDAKIIGDAELYRNGVKIGRVSGTPTGVDEWKLEAEKIIVYSDILSSGDTYRLRYQTLSGGSSAVQTTEGRKTLILERVISGNVSFGTDSSRLTTNGDTPNGSNTVLLSNNSTVGVHVKLIGRRTDADGEGAYFEISGAFERNANAASTSIIGNELKFIVANDNPSDWSARIIEDSTNGGVYLEVEQTNSAAKTVSWKAYVEVVIISE